MPEHTPDPSQRSLDMQQMADHWMAVDAILAGVKGMREMAGEFLPRFPDEGATAYAFRVKTSKFTNIFRDITENLSQRPFANPVELQEDSYGPDIEEFIENVDGQGSNLHAFAGESFFAAVNYGIDWILVDYTPDVPEGATRAEEREIGVRPYWVRYNASNVLAVHSKQVGGVETITHFRAYEPATVAEGFEETSKNLIRVVERRENADGSLGRPMSSLWEQQEDADGNIIWVQGAEREMTISQIPLVPLLTGRRLGSSWQIHPPMMAAAELQIEHFQQESGLKYAKTMTAFPMLSGKNVEPELDDNGTPKPVPVGPHRVVYAPNGQFEWIEPDSNSLKFLADDIKETAKELRELGRQPLTAQSGNLTVITTSVAAEKANSAIQAWALMLRAALERALVFTAEWLKVDDTPVVALDLDFDLSTGEDDGYGHVLKLRKAGEISRPATLHEAKRRGILDRKFSAEDDAELLLGDLESDGVTEDDEGDDDKDEGEDDDGDDE